MAKLFVESCAAQSALQQPHNWNPASRVNGIAGSAPLRQFALQLALSCPVVGPTFQQPAVAQVEAEIDRAAARLWGLTDMELDGLRRALEELKGEDLSPAVEEEDEEEA